ncbi:MAG: cytochrome c3 family protein [Desulfobia sp.]
MDTILSSARRGSRVLIGPALFFAGGLLVMLPGLSWAAVSGPCSNCHTMHNSQDSSPITRTGDGVGWSAGGELSGNSTSESPADNLLVSDCVGCHTSTTSDQTIVDLGGNKVPIVYNTSGYPDDALAGGNFYQVAQGEDYDGYGHNVRGISAIDSQLDEAPGNTRCSGPASSCHNTLAVPPDCDNYNRGGCQGCHYDVFHHEDNDNYRFLNSHERPQSGYVVGVEHEYWEHPDHTASHNYYKGVDEPDNNGINLKTTQSISSYCGGCHNNFHGSDGTGTGSPWLRHPSDIALPDEGEYAAYDPTTTGYNLQAPVAWIDPENPTRAEAVVMCLSCHRVHGSQYPDILRWDYDSMIAGGGGGAAEGEGCFVCHSSKDE